MTRQPIFVLSWNRAREELSRCFKARPDLREEIEEFIIKIDRRINFNNINEIKPDSLTDNNLLQVRGQNL